ncbi:MAG TPA: hypothetical protein VF503_03780 [Sphingobium sp.]|uniref:hypothetical protein n=1 Tax=Sphingobium sp. TaxID=1912891 RepID=UPI002ED50224
MSIELIRPGAHRAAPEPKPLISRDCGPEGCEVDWLASRRVEAELDIEDFTKFSLEMGWGDGLPLIPPTDARVRTFLSENDRYPDEVIGEMPGNVECTVEKIVINAVMAGAPPESLELLIAMISSIADPDFELYGVNATTAPVYPAFVVNGPIRQALDIPYSYGCLGGVPGNSASLGRAIRLMMRNIAGQTTGGTSQTTFGSPGRVAGIVTGEWEEKSPWAPLGERRGVAGNAVTSFGTMGTMNVIDTTSHSATDFLEMVGRSYAYAGCNNFSGAVPFGEALIALNPICAEIVGKQMPNIEDVQEVLWKFASLHESEFNKEHRDQLALQERIRGDGRVYATPEPKDILVFVAGGLGGLHAACFHTFGTSLSQTKPVASVIPVDQAQAAE